MNETHPSQLDHMVHRFAWFRSAVLGANDGIVSISSLIVGVAAATSDKADVMVAGVAGLVAGTISMAAGVYVSVSSQADAERADIAREKKALEEHPERELDELVAIYESRGVEPGLAREVAEDLMEKDALVAHTRDEIGISAANAAKPMSAALASTAAFAVGAAPPVLATLLSSFENIIPAVAGTSLVCLVGLGAMSAAAGGARLLPAVARVTLWGAFAMALTTAIGSLF
ncbi:MAG TPA: hypothetical protein DIU07_18505 [Rhodobacteraceae bacterium]|nr:hypothetical protein [Paracoccaceae bacterium]